VRQFGSQLLKRWKDGITDGVWLPYRVYSQLLAVSKRQVLTSEGENAQAGAFIVVVFGSSGET